MLRNSAGCLVGELLSLVRWQALKDLPVGAPAQAAGSPGVHWRGLALFSSHFRYYIKYISSFP